MMQKGDGEGVEDDYTKQMVCRFLVRDGSALIENLWWTVKNEGKRRHTYRGNDTEEEGTLWSE